MSTTLPWYTRRQFFKTIPWKKLRNYPRNSPVRSNTSGSSVHTGVNEGKNKFDKSLWSMRNNYAHMVHSFTHISSLNN